MGKLLYLPGDQKQPSGNQLVTLDDLEKFRINLLMDIRRMLDGQLSKPPKRWIKSREVEKLLNISIRDAVRPEFRTNISASNENKKTPRWNDYNYTEGSRYYQ
jgi:hypothetical protein